MLKYRIPQIVTLTQYLMNVPFGKKIQLKRKPFLNFRNGFLFVSLLSDSNQRPRDYKSRALAN